MASPTYVLVLVSVLGLPAPAADPPSREITREMRAPSAEICSENDGRPPPMLPVPLAFVFVVFVFVRGMGMCTLAEVLFKIILPEEVMGRD